MKSTFSTLLNEKLINKIKNSFAPFQKKKNFLSKIYNICADKENYIFMLIINVFLSLFSFFFIPLFLFFMITNATFFSFLIYAVIHKRYQNKKINLEEKNVSCLLPDYIIPDMNTETHKINNEIEKLTKEEFLLFNDILLIDNRHPLTLMNTVVITYLILKKIRESTIEEVRENKNIILNFIETNKKLSEYNADLILNELTAKCSKLTKKEKIESINNSLTISNKEITTKNIVIKNI